VSMCWYQSNLPGMAWVWNIIFQCNKTNIKNKHHQNTIESQNNLSWKEVQEFLVCIRAQSGAN